MIICLIANFSFPYQTIYDTHTTMQMSTNRVIDSQRPDIRVCVDDWWSQYKWDIETGALFWCIKYADEVIHDNCAVNMKNTRILSVVRNLWRVHHCLFNHARQSIVR